METLTLMYNWFNRFCVGRARLFSERNNEGGGNSDPLCCILARKPVVRTLRGAARPGHLKIRIYDWPAVWCARGGGRKYQPFMYLEFGCYSFLYNVFALEQYLAYQVYVYVIPETGFEHPVLYGTRNTNATGVTEPMIDGTLE